MGFVNFQVDSGQIALLFLLIHPSTGWFRPDVPEGCHKLYWVVSKQLSPQDIDQDVKNFPVMLHRHRHASSIVFENRYGGLTHTSRRSASYLRHTLGYFVHTSWQNAALFNSAA